MSTDSLHKQQNGDALVHSKNAPTKHHHQREPHPPPQSTQPRGHRPRAGTWHGKDGSGTPVGSRQRVTADDNRSDKSYRPELPVEYEPTYKMEPDHRLSTQKAEAIITDVFQEHLGDKKYEAAIMNKKSKTICDVIKDRMKELGMERYKILCWVSISQKNSQSIQVSSRCLWDPKHDNFACVNYQNSTMNATGLVFVVYTE